MENEDLALFSSRLKFLRLQLMLTQKEFAERVGLTASALSAYENNVKNPSLLVALKIANEYHVSIDWLCGISQKKSLAEWRTFENYSEIIDVLTSISKSYYLEIEPRTKTSALNSDEEFSIYIDDDVIQCFFKEWIEIIKLRHHSTITENLYELWINDKKKEYDFSSRLIDGELNEKARIFLENKIVIHD